MAFILSSTQYVSVRAVIGLDTDAVNLPDSILNLSVYKGEAERYIMRNLTPLQYNNVTWADEAIYAATLYLASLVVPSLRVIQSERIAGGDLTYSSVNLEKLAQRLAAQAAARVSEIQTALPTATPVTPVQSPHFFGKASRHIPHATPWLPGVSSGQVLPDPDQFAWNEVPVGAVNGSNTVFVTAFAFIDSSVAVYINGVLQMPGTAFMPTEPQTIVMTVAPLADDEIIVNYEKQL